jgi:hypothetical protein
MCRPLSKRKIAHGPFVEYYCLANEHHTVRSIVRLANVGMRKIRLRASRTAAEEVRHQSIRQNRRARVGQIRQGQNTANNKRMAVPGSKQPSTQMPAALVVAASCPLRSGGVLSQSLKAPSTRSTALRRYYRRALRHASTLCAINWHEE